MQRFSPLFESVMLEPQKQRLRRTWSSWGTGCLRDRAGRRSHV